MSSLSRDEVLFWSKKYDQEEDLYNAGLEETLGDKLRRTKELTMDDLVQIMRWKFQGRLAGRQGIMLKHIFSSSADFVRRTSTEAFNEEGDCARLKKLMGRYGGIKGVGLAVASVIWTFYDPSSYGVYDIHAWREFFGKEPRNLFSSFGNLMKFLSELREEARRLNLNARVVEKAYFKKNLDASKRELRCS